MRQYQDLIEHISEHGTIKGDRTGTGTMSVFGYQARFNLKHGFPLLTTKKLHLRSIVHELLWFLAGDTNIKRLVDNGVNIWNEWAYVAYLDAHGMPVPARQTTDWTIGLNTYVGKIKSDPEFALKWGDLGPIYSKQWRDFGGIDQISWVAERLKTHPDCRRLIVSAWNPAEMADMALPPCHRSFQLWTRELADGRRELSLQVDQRSSDTGLGVPFNWASYALLTHMFAQSAGMEVGELIWNSGDTHIYSNHIEGLNVQMARQPRQLPTLELKDRGQSIFDFQFEDFEIVGYDPHPHIAMEVSV